MKKLTAKIDGPDILFYGWEDGLADYLVGSLAQALNSPASEPKVLVYCARIEFAIAGEIVPLFFDDWDDAHIELRKNTEAVVRLVIDCIRNSETFDLAE